MTLQELFDTPEKWTKNYSARGASGVPVNSCHHAASCWCLDGAMVKLYSGTPACWDEVKYKLQQAIWGLYPNYLGWSHVMFNDDFRTTFADIRRVIEHANI